MRRLWQAWLNSLSGLKLAFEGEAAFRQDLLLAALLCPLAFWLAPDRPSLALMLFSLLVLLVVELLNTGIEAAVNHTGTDLHPQAKKAKDTASAAVLIALIAVGMVWGCVLFG